MQDNPTAAPDNTSSVTATMTATPTMTVTPTMTPTATPDPLLQTASPVPPVQVIPTLIMPTQDPLLAAPETAVTSLSGAVAETLTMQLTPEPSPIAPTLDPALAATQDPGTAPTLDPTVAAAMPALVDPAAQPSPQLAVADPAVPPSADAASVVMPTFEQPTVIVTLDPTVAAIIPDAVMTMVAATQAPLMPTLDPTVAAVMPANPEAPVAATQDPALAGNMPTAHPAAVTPVPIVPPADVVPAIAGAPDTVPATAEPGAAPDVGVPSPETTALLPDAIAPIVDLAAATPVESNADAAPQNSIVGTITSDSRSPAFVILTDPAGQVAATAIVAPDGRYALPAVPPGSYTLTIDDGVSLLVQQHVALAGSLAEVAPIALHWGDFNRDGVIDELDVVTVAAQYGQPAPTTPVLLDITGDGLIGLGELFTVAENFGLGR